MREELEGPTEQTNKQRHSVSAEAETTSAKYVFLDVVGFTHNRNVEAQSYVVETLNSLVLSAMQECRMTDPGARIFIPTGDGMCIALLNTEGRRPYDIHMSIAVTLLQLLEGHNLEQPDSAKRFQIRIGINANEDNLVRDINDNRNVAGAGISMASRIMDKADGSQILISDAVFDRLQQREKYADKFRSYWTSDKHGKRFQVHQYTADHPGMNTELPSSAPRPVEPGEANIAKLTIETAYYLAHAIKNRAFLASVFKSDRGDNFALQLLLHLLARDSVAQLGNTDFRERSLLTWNAGAATIQDQYEHYAAIDHKLVIATFYLIRSRMEVYEDLFESSGVNYLFVNNTGLQKLHEEFSDIWSQFELDNFLSQ